MGKHGILLNFLSGMLRDEGGLDYKASIADTIITVIEENPEAKENGLAHLCEFIEDCEHTSLAVRILHLLGQEGPRTANPARYIRFIYNRVLLENATVRAAAISAMARFGALCDDLLPNVLVLLSRCQMDADDEVRDRATYFKAILEQHEATLNSQYILNSLTVSISSLEKSLHAYTLNQAAASNPFDMKTVPAAAIEDAKPDSDEGYDDEYQLEDIEIAVADYVQRVMKGNFAPAWEELGQENELEDTFSLPFKTLEEAVKNIVVYLGLQPCERSDKV